MSLPFARHKQQKELNDKANLMRTKNSFKEAVGYYLNSVLLDRNNAESYFGLGVCYKNLGKINKAISSLEKSALLDKNNYETFFELGLCHLEDKTPCKAIKCFIQAVQLEPENPEAIYHLGIAHEKCEEEDIKTLTLTVNRMLTGSTVEQWDTMIYLKDTASPQEYDQAIFRLQNQFTRS